MTSVRTGISGFEKILQDKGFMFPPSYNKKSLSKDGLASKNHGLVVLIKGDPGTGKTTLALQMLRGMILDMIGAEEEDIFATYYSLEQHKEDLKAKYGKMWYFFVEDLIRNLEYSIHSWILNVKRDIEFKPNDEQLGQYEKIVEEKEKAVNKIKYSTLGIKHFLQLIKSSVSKECCKYIGKRPGKYFNDIRQDDFNDIKSSLRKTDQENIKLFSKDFSIDSIIDDFNEFVEELLQKINKTSNYEVPHSFLVKCGLINDKGQIEKTIKELFFNKLFPENKVERVNVRTAILECLENVCLFDEVCSQSICHIKFRDMASLRNKDAQTHTTQVDSLYVINDLLNDKKIKNNFIVVDGLNSIDKETFKNVNVNSLIKSLREASPISIIVFEPDKNSDGVIEHLVDSVIDLRNTYTQDGLNYHLHELQISKSRYQYAVFGWHQYKIRDYGFCVYTSIHNLVNRQQALTDEMYNSVQSLQQKIESDTNHLSDEEKEQLKQKKKKKKYDSNGSSIIEDILYGVKPGSTTVIMGTRGTFKSTLTLDYLFAGAEIGEKGLLLSLIENEGTAREEMRCPRKDGDHEDPVCEKSKKGDDPTQKVCSDCRQNLYLFHQRPGCVTSAEFLNIIQRRLELEPGEKIKRIAFWDLTQLEHRFPFIAEDKMFLPALMDLCRNNNISLVIMGSENNRYSQAASAMADNIVFVWRDSLIKGPKLKELEGDEIRKKEINEAVNKCTKEGILATREHLMLYVDRCEGKIGGEGKNLSAIMLKSQHENSDGFTLTPKFTNDAKKENCDLVDIDYKVNVDVSKASEYYHFFKGGFPQNGFIHSPEKIKVIEEIQAIRR